MKTPVSLETLARQALDGDRQALDTLVRALQDDIYRLALRMLWNREDAEDATQEILVRIVTRLSQFGFRSRLTTWAYRLSVNYILDLKKSPIERLELTFQRFAENLTEGIEPASVAETERSMLIDEVKVGCSLAMPRGPTCGRAFRTHQSRISVGSCRANGSRPWNRRRCRRSHCRDF